MTDEKLWIEVYECHSCLQTGILIHSSRDGPCPLAQCPECDNVLTVVKDPSKRDSIIAECKAKMVGGGMTCVEVMGDLARLSKEISILRGDDRCPVCNGHCGYTEEKGCQAEEALQDPYSHSGDF